MEKSLLKIKTATVGCMEKLRPNSELTIFETKGVTFKNQRHYFQLVVKNLQPWALYNVRVEITGKLAPFITLGVIDCVPAEFTLTDKADDYYLGGTGSYPDVIRPLKNGDLILPPSGIKCLWVCAESDGDLPAGVFSIGFRLYDAENKFLGETEYELEVLNARVERPDIKKTNWMHYDCICNAHGVEPFTAEFYKIFEKYLAAYTRSGFNMLLTPLFTPPLDTYVGGERKTAQLVGVSLDGGVYSFDFTLLKEFIRFVLARGIKYIEFSHLFTQWGGEHCPKIIAEVNGEKRKIFGWENDSLGEYTTFLGAFLTEFVKFLKKEKIDNICCFHITDEPNERHIERYKALRQTVKSNIGDIPTIDAVSHYEYYKQGLVDIPVPTVSAADEFIKRGVKEMLTYYCCEPYDGYYSNRFLNMPLMRTRILGCQLYLAGVGGFLHWGFNFYNSGLSYYSVDPYADTNAGGAFPPGDGFIVYPEKDGVNLSLRSEMMAACFEDYDILYTLEKKIGREKVKELLKNEGIAGFNRYPKDPVRFTEFINGIKRAILDACKNA